MRRLALEIGNMGRIAQQQRMENSPVDSIRTTLSARLQASLAYLQQQMAGFVSPAPLREMVTRDGASANAEKIVLDAPPDRAEDVNAYRATDPAGAPLLENLCEHLLALLRTLERQLARVSLYQ